MSGAESDDEHEPRDSVTLGVRFVEGQIDRAKVRTTLTWQVVPRLSLGVEYNPLADDVSPLANLRLVSESEHRPAVMLGTSSDRIGTPSGQSYYATISKSLKSWTGLPVAPYVGAAYGTFEDKWRWIGGVNMRFTEHLSSLVLFDGVHVHPTLSWSQGRHVLSLLLISGEHVGVSYSIALPGPRSLLRARH